MTSSNQSITDTSRSETAALDDTAHSTSAPCEKTRAKDIAQYGIVTIDTQSSVYRAIALMVKYKVSGLPVVNGSNLVGIITEKDVLQLLYDTEFVAGNVSDYMTESIITFDEQDSLSDICKCLIDNNFRRVPIIQRGKLAGLVSRADLIRANKESFRRPIDHKQSVRPAAIIAADVMTTGLLTVKRNSSIYIAMHLIAENNITGLPVVDDYNNLIGIITEKDLLGLLYDDGPKPAFVGDCMTRQIVSFNIDDCLFEICACLVNHNFRRVPILEKGKLLGLISRADIIAFILKNRSHFHSQKRLL